MLNRIKGDSLCFVAVSPWSRAWRGRMTAMVSPSSPPSGIAPSAAGSCSDANVRRKIHALVGAGAGGVEADLTYFTADEDELRI
jgi:hypothetical protein